MGGSGAKTANAIGLLPRGDEPLRKPIAGVGDVVKSYYRRLSLTLFLFSIIILQKIKCTKTEDRLGEPGEPG